MIDFVIDWETFATTPDAVVLTFAITAFDEDKLNTFDELVEQSQMWKFDIDSQINDGRFISPDTLRWWEKQPPEVLKAQCEPSDNDITLDQFVVSLSDYLLSHGHNSRESQFYCRGASFDFPIMDNVVENHSHFNSKMFPCPFWNQNDLRSYIRGMFVDRKNTKVPLPKGSLDDFVHHDPLHDCVRAAMHIQHARAYAMGLIDIPEGDEIDPNSNK